MYREDLPIKGPVALYIHGTMSSYDHNFTNELAQKLAKEHGIRSFRYNSRFSATEFEPTHRYRFSGYDDDIDDMMHVVKALKSDGFEVNWLIGHSRGANDALIYASRYCSNIDALTSEFHRLSASTGNDENLVNESRSTKDLSHFLNPDKLSIIAISPRYNMQNMLSAIFSAEKIQQLETEGEFIWETPRGNVPVVKSDAKITEVELKMDRIVTSIPDQVMI
jgi:hypothetical protein